MQNDVVCAGFGGQGVLLIGKVLAYAGMKAGKEVSWFPSYGPEMRGGTANCTVVISDKPIGSPVIQHPRSLIAMNLPSLDKFEPMLRDKAFVLINTSLVNREPARDDLKVLKVPASSIAIEEGSPRAANMVALGAYVGGTGVVEPEVVEGILEQEFGKKPKVLEINLKAFRRGYELGAEARNAS
jgi:2-oxoglutarate ferredoxin oxidoreductase subunit gamma